MLRPFAIAGAAIVGAGFVVSAPPSVGHLPGATTLREVTLATDSSSLPDFLTPWIDQFNTASENATRLLNTFSSAPFVDLQQFIANQAGYLQDFFNDPSSSTVASISSEMQANLAAVLTSYTLLDAAPNSDTLNTVIQHTVESFITLPNHTYLVGNIGDFLPSNVNAAEVTPIIQFLASPLSGIIMGDLGPAISPWVALSNSISAGDNLNETLANMVGAYFNGATLSLNSLIPSIEQAGFLPQGLNIENLDIGFGGLLSPGDVGPGGLVGGSILNSVGIDLVGAPLNPVGGSANLPSYPVGPIGAWEGLVQTIASLLGWDGTGSPLADVTLPTIPTGLFDLGTASSGMAADFSGLVQDLVSGLGL